MPHTHATLADALNHGCRCQTLDTDQLLHELGRDAGLRDVASTLAQTHPHLFSSTAVFASQATVQAVQAAVAAIERTLSLPAWAQQVLPGASAMAQIDHGPLGVFMGYDFHITPTGPQLIEINTNAGGAMLNAVLLRAQAVCCGLMNPALNAYRNMATLEDEFVAMFQAEWDLFNRARGQAPRPLRSIAIVDEAPHNQYLAPEFALFAELFGRHGIQTVVADPASLQLRDGVLYCDALALDLVYNRLTDFDFSDTAHTALAQAYAEDVVAVTPHPRAHALRANKQHLVTLGQPAALQALGVSPADQQILLATVPACERVSSDNAAALWEQRKNLSLNPWMALAPVRFTGATSSPKKSGSRSSKATTSPKRWCPRRCAQCRWATRLPNSSLTCAPTPMPGACNYWPPAPTVAKPPTFALRAAVSRR